MSDERRCAAHVISGSLIIGTPRPQTGSAFVTAAFYSSCHENFTVCLFFLFFSSLAPPFLNHYANRGRH